MKASNDNIELLIREALGQEDQDVFEQLGEQSLLEKQMEVFRSQARWITALVLVVGIASIALSAYSAVRLYNAPEVRETILWAVVFFFSMSTVMAIKLWDWMEIERTSVTREIKRLELRVARLANELRASSPLH